MIEKILFMLALVAPFHVFAQEGTVQGRITNREGVGIESVSIHLTDLSIGTKTDSSGHYIFQEIPEGMHSIQVSHVGYKTNRAQITVSPGKVTDYSLVLEESDNASLEEVVITGTMREVSRLDSPVPVEVFTPTFFRKNPTPSLFDAVAMINGIKPQLNCNVCNTGDIHINGMEGPYTMILIDGMPIVSALSTVYGLSGIPNSLVERIEVVKGPASSLYGSEAMGGIINVITRNPDKAPVVSADIFGTTWGEVSADAGLKFKHGTASQLLGVNYFNFQNRIDHNGDHFTDMTLQNRISVFDKWNWKRAQNRVASLAGRYVYEDRWGGEMNWNKSYRGSDEVYGESIYTKRAEIIGMYQLPTVEKIFTQFSYNWHHQDSRYGNSSYIATQQVAFLQAYWDKAIGEQHNLLMGTSLRYTVYDDNTPATASPDGNWNEPAKTPLPGFFVQDEWKINSLNTLLLGYRYDHDKNNGNVHSPRIAYKFSPSMHHSLRASFGTGFRVVNLFTEDHAALTGAREVFIAEELKPERSYNGNLNYEGHFPGDFFSLGLDATGFYSYFTNKIVGDFDTDPNKIIYDNLRGHAVSQGISLNTNFTFSFPLTIQLGVTYMDVFQLEDEGKEAKSAQKIQQLHAPKWSGTWVASWGLPKSFSLDLTGQWYGPMRLPIQPHDYRPAYSPWFCLANVQVTKKMGKGLECYGGVKNLFNFLPKDPLMRPFDPFDKQVDDPVNNPYGYTFDTEYNYTSLQGIRGFLGVRYHLF